MRRYLDRLTNKLTMYRLVIRLLMAMAVISLVLSFVSVLQFNPLSMLIGLVLLVGTSLVVNYLFSYMFSVRPHNESAVISALILFFIFSPPSSPSSFITMIGVASIAMASKYLLAWRGRHIFNPAAIAAVISGIIGLQYASWWVATAPLTLISLIFGALVLYKTRRLQMGMLYINVSVLTIFLVNLINGQNLIGVIPLLLTAWPLLFFAGFMLSEPLTLPPRRYQRYIIAGIVGVLANAQIVILGVSSSPEIALVIGYAIAFMYGQRGRLRLTFVSRRLLAKDQVEYTFTSNRRLRFISGQYIELQLPHSKPDARGTRRMFTITSSPGDVELKIATRHYYPSSTYKKALLHMPPGSTLSATGIYGDFILPSDSSRKVLFIAGGIGVTPFYTQMQSLIAKDKKRDGVLLYAVRSQDDVIYKDVLSSSKHGIITHVTTNPIDEEYIKKYVPDISERHVYISGPPGMVEATSQLIGRYAPLRISKDYFSGY